MLDVGKKIKPQVSVFPILSAKRKANGRIQFVAYIFHDVNFYTTFAVIHSLHE